MSLIARTIENSKSRFTISKAHAHQIGTSKSIPVATTNWATRVHVASARTNFDDCELTEKERFELLHKYGNFTLAYSAATQKGLKYFGNSNCFLAYGKRFGQSIALGNPLGPDELTEDLLRNFIAKHKRPGFCQLNEKNARIVSKLGHYVNEMGFDTTLDLENYDFCGKSKEWLRYASNWINKRNFKIQEMTIAGD